MAGEDIAVLGIKVTSDDVLRAIKRLDKLEDQAKKTENGTKKLSRSFGGLKTAFAALGVTLLTRKLIGQINTYTELTNKIRLVTKSTKNLANVQNTLFDVSQDSRASLEATNDLYFRLAKSTETLNISQSRLIGLTKTIGKAVAITGASSASSSAALMQFGQALSGNFKASAQELNSIKEQTPRLAQAIADGLGVPTSALKKMAEAGELSTKKVIAALERTSRKVKTEFNSTEKTIAQAGLQISNTFLKTFGTLKGGGIVQSLDEFRAIISDPKVIAGIKGLVQALIDLSVIAFKIIGVLTNIGDAIGKNISKALNPVPDRLRDINSELGQLEIQKKSLIAGINRGDSIFNTLFGSDEDTIAVARRFDTVRAKISQLQKERENLLNRNKVKGGKDAAGKGSPETAIPGVVQLDNTESELARVQKFEDQLTALKISNLKGRTLAIAEFEEEKRQLDEQVLNGDIEATLEFNALKEELEKSHQNKLNEIAEEATNTRRALLTSELGAASNIFGQLSNLISQQGKKQNAASRVLAAVSIGINTASAIINALAVPPYPLGVALAVGAGLKGANALASIGASSSSIPKTTTLPTIAGSQQNNQSSSTQIPTNSVVNELRVVMEGDAVGSESMRKFAENLAETISDMGGVQTLVIS